MMHQLACHECDLVQTVPPLPSGAAVTCARCGNVLFRSKPDSINRVLAWTVASVVLYAVVLFFPFLAMKSGAIVQHSSLTTGIRELYAQNETLLATLVLLTCVLVPLFEMCALLYVFFPLKMNRKALYGAAVFRLFQNVRPWSMMEIYMLGILVAMVKLGHMATLVPGLAVFAFGLLIFTLTFAVSAIDAHLIWERLGGGR